MRPHSTSIAEALSRRTLRTLRTLRSDRTLRTFGTAGAGGSRRSFGAAWAGRAGRADGARLARSALAVPNVDDAIGVHVFPHVADTVAVEIPACVAGSALGASRTRRALRPGRTLHARRTGGPRRPGWTDGADLTAKTLRAFGTLRARRALRPLRAGRTGRAGRAGRALQRAKSYGGAYLAMNSQDMGADVVLAWPTGAVAVMGAEGAANIIYRREIQASKDKAATRAAKIAEYRARFDNPYVAAGRGYIDDVIEPQHTRSALVRHLRMLATKEESRPYRKHGNMPL